MASAALTVAPDAREGLIVVGRVPVGVEHHKPTGAHQVQPAAARLAAQHEHEDLALREPRTGSRYI